jgi:hypothetical protein
MNIPHYIGLKEAREVLSGIGIDLNERQMKRAADRDAQGKRKLPFFVDPIDGKLKIEKGSLLAIYNGCRVEAEKNAHYKPGMLSKTFETKT